MEPIEVEVKIPISDAEAIKGQLLQHGFVPGMVHEETDIYFNSENYDLKARDKALRIRQVRDMKTGKTWAQFNCKGPKLDGVSVSRTEIETSVDDPEAIKSILAQLSFYPVACTVRKIRYYYTRDKITASIDQVEGLGDFLELEILEQVKDRKNACLEDIQKTMKQLGLCMKDTVRTSYLSMLQKNI